jgi:hypothetical protein
MVFLSLEVCKTDGEGIEGKDKVGGDKANYITLPPPTLGCYLVG